MKLGDFTVNREGENLSVVLAVDGERVWLKNLQYGWYYRGIRAAAALPFVGALTREQSAAAAKALADYAEWCAAGGGFVRAALVVGSHVFRTSLRRPPLGKGTNHARYRHRR